MFHPRGTTAEALWIAWILFLGTAHLAATSPVVLSVTSQSLSTPASGPETPEGAGKPSADADHSPQHGGLFLLSTDYHHQLEGKLEAPGSFYLWLYDERSQPLSTAQLKQVKGTVQWGAANKSTRTPIGLTKDGQRLEALSPGSLKLPITLTLSIEFPGNPPNRKPELFTFPILRFSSDVETTQQPVTGTNSTDHSGSGYTSAPRGDKSADTLERHPPH